MLKNATGISLLLGLSNMAFLLLFGIVAFHNHLVADDFRFLWNVHQYGILKGVQVEYNFWVTRYASIFLCYTLLSLMQYKYALFIIGMAEVSAFILSLAFLLRSALSYLPVSRIKGIGLLNISAFITNGFFFSTLGIDQTWFWFSSSCTYIWSIIFLFTGIALLINKGIMPVVRAAGVIISFLYVGGSYEVLALLLLIGLSVILIRLTIKRRLLIRQNMLWVAAFVVLGIALVIAALGHGNEVRRQYTWHVGLVSALVLNFKTMHILLIKKMPHVLPYLIAFSIPFVYPGYIIGHERNMPKPNMRQVITFLLSGGLLYGALVYLYNYPITYLLGDIGPDRSFAFLCLVTFLLSAGVAFYIGMSFRALIMKYAWLAIVPCLAVNIYMAWQQYNVPLAYSKEFNEWRNTLSDDNGAKTEYKPVSIRD